VGDEAVHKELGDRMERAATTTSSFEAEQDSGGYTPGSDEGRKKLNELTELCTKLSEKVTSLEQDFKQTKQVYGKALTKLVKKGQRTEEFLSTDEEIAQKIVGDEVVHKELGDRMERAATTASSFEVEQDSGVLGGDSQKGTHLSINEDILKDSLFCTPPIRHIHQGRYGVSVPALHKRPRMKQDQYAISKEDQYAIFKLWK
ncbi:hypothetical protein Tco_0673101, partial [Tanacetum coccineum]